MIAYFDTSALIPLLIDEPTSANAGELWLSATRVASSRLIYPEACSALARARRDGRLTDRQSRWARQELANLVDQIDHVEVSETIARIAGTLTEQHELRAYDAVHLASAAILKDDDFVFITNDRRLGHAALATGLNTASLT